MMNFSYGAVQTGYERGNANGRKEGREETKRDTALKMLADDMPEDKVMKYSGLSKEEVEKLKSSL